MATDSSQVAPRRRWFRYSMRTFFVLVTAICVVLGLYVKRQRDRHEAIETILSWGGVVKFAGSRAKSLGTPASKRPVLATSTPQNKLWQQKLFGKYYGPSVVVVDLIKTEFASPGATLDLGVLAPLTELKFFQIGKTMDEVTLLQLPRLPSLESLNLFPETKISDPGLECLDRLPKLKILRINNASLSADGLARIGAVSTLQMLLLSFCDMPDDSLAHLTKLPDLTTLTLPYCSISDAAVPHLSNLRQLTYIQLEGTNVTEEGKQKLRAALPNCRF